MLKAYLFENDIEFSKTHDIRRLLNLGSDLEPEWEQFIDESARLTSYAIEARYPGSIATKELLGTQSAFAGKCEKVFSLRLICPMNCRCNPPQMFMKFYPKKKSEAWVLILPEKERPYCIVLTDAGTQPEADALAKEYAEMVEGWRKNN